MRYIAWLTKPDYPTAGGKLSFASGGTLEEAIESAKVHLKQMNLGRMRETGGRHVVITAGAHQTNVARFHVDCHTGALQPAGAV